MKAEPNAYIRKKPEYFFHSVASAYQKQAVFVGIINNILQTDIVRKTKWKNRLYQYTVTIWLNISVLTMSI